MSMALLCRTTLLLVILLSFAACTSRYKYDLYQTADEIRRKVKVEETKFIPNAVLGDPNGPNKFVTGAGNTIVVTTGTRGLTHETDNYTVLRFDEYLRCDIYIELSNPVATESIQLTDHSYLLIRGRYDQPAGSKLFQPESGTLTVDSLRGDHMFTTLRGLYRNAEKVPLTFDGNVKIKYRE